MKRKRAQPSDVGSSPKLIANASPKADTTGSKSKGTRKTADASKNTLQSAVKEGAVAQPKKGEPGLTNGAAENKKGLPNGNHVAEEHDSDAERSSEADANTDEDDKVASGSEEELLQDEMLNLTTQKAKAGRPKGSKTRPLPSPPPNGPPQEHYFFQTRSGGAQASNNTLPSSLLLSHDQYFDALRRHKDSHQDEMSFLLDLYAAEFKQWEFRLEQQFNLCLYGWGSKRRLLNGFAKYLVTAPDQEHRILIVNGYHHSTSVRDIIHDLARMIPELQKQKLSGSLSDMIATVLAALKRQTAAADSRSHNGEDLRQCPCITVVIHSMDWRNLRRQSAQTLLALLASSPFIRLVASVDQPHVHLLWDLALKAKFNFLFHDVTTFQSYDVEMNGSSGGVVDEVNSLLGRSGRKLRGKEGVINVLMSLTESARRLYALFIAELLSVEPLQEEARTADSVEMPSIEFRALQKKAVQQLIATGDVQFRQLLKEFFEHEMLTTKRDAAGTEVLGVPFRREECESILEDLALDEG